MEEAIKDNKMTRCRVEQDELNHDLTGYRSNVITYEEKPMLDYEFSINDNPKRNPKMVDLGNGWSVEQ